MGGEGGAFSIISMVFWAGCAGGGAVSIGAAAMDGFSTDMGIEEGVEGGDGACSVVGDGEGGGDLFVYKPRKKFAL